MTAIHFNFNTYASSGVAIDVYNTIYNKNMCIIYISAVHIHNMQRTYMYEVGLRTLLYYALHIVFTILTITHYPVYYYY